MICEKCNEVSGEDDPESTTYGHVELLLCLECRRNLDLILAKEEVNLKAQTVQKEIELIVNSGDIANLPLLREKMAEAMHADHAFNKFVVGWVRE